MNISKKKLQEDWPGKYRRFPHIYDGSYLVLNNLSKQIRDAIKQVVEESKNKKLRILDVGCGSKPYYPFFERAAGEYIGIDVCKSNSIEVIAKGENLPFQSDTFDVVISTQVLYRVDNPIWVIRELHRCLKDGGYLLLSTPCIWSTDGAKWLYTKLGLETLFSIFSYVNIEPNCRAGGTFFFLLNLYIVKLIRAPLYPIFFLNNVLGSIFEKIIQSDIFVTNYFVLARK